MLRELESQLNTLPICKLVASVVSLLLLKLLCICFTCLCCLFTLFHLRLFSTGMSRDHRVSLVFNLNVRNIESMF